MRRLARKLEESLGGQVVGYVGTYIAFALFLELNRAVSPSFKYSGWLPFASIGNLLAIAFFLLASYWWWDVAAGRAWPKPRWFTSLSGSCTLVVILSTGLALSFGRQVVATLMLRSGAILAAILVDLCMRKQIAARAWAAAVLSIASVAVAIPGGSFGDYRPFLFVLVLANVVAYAIRYRLMTQFGRGAREERKRYCVEEQVVATPGWLAAMLLGCLVASFFQEGHAPRPLGGLLRGLLLEAPQLGELPWLFPLLVGIFMAGTGVFGTLIMLYPRENVYGATLSRAGAIVGTYVGVLLAAPMADVFNILVFPGASVRVPTLWEAGGAVLGVAAMVILSWPIRTKARLRHTAASAADGEVAAKTP